MIDSFSFSDLMSLFNMLIIPLFVWIWKTDRKTLILETKLESNSVHTLLVVEKLDEIKDELHNSFVSQRSCDFRHNSINKG